MTDDLDRAIAEHVAEPPLSRDVDPARVGRYRGLGEVLAHVARLRERGASVRVAGRSHEGAPIVRVDIGSGGIGEGPKSSLLVAGIHAMEWIGVETGLALLDEIVARSPADRRLVAFPVLNPDGYRRVERDLRAGRRTFARGNALGVDLNRNWPTHWRPTPLVPRLLPRLGLPSVGEHGESSGSEPEVRAVLDALDELAAGGAKLERALSLHSFGNMLLLPYGGRWGLPESYPRLHAIASTVRTALHDRYRIRTPSRWFPGFFAYGMELDHFLHCGAEPMLVECPTGFSLRDRSSWAHPFRWYNPRDLEEPVRDLVTALAPFLGYSAGA